MRSARWIAIVLMLAGCGESLESRKRAALEEQRLAGDQGFEVRRMTEVERIEALLLRLSASDVIFIKNGREMSSEAAARMLRRQYERHGDRISTAEQFIGMLCTRGRVLGRPYDIKTSDGRIVAAPEWLMAELKSIDPLPVAPGAIVPPTVPLEGAGEAATRSDAGGTTTAPSRSEAALPPAPDEIESAPASITAALERIEALPVRFIVDADDRTRRQEMDAKDFVKMLRRKTQWLGADLTTVPRWLDEIGSRSFRTLAPYRVVLRDQVTMDVGPWLKGRWQLRDEVPAATTPAPPSPEQVPLHSP